VSGEHGEHGEHGDLPVAARVRRLEERLIAAGLATDEELDDILERVFSSASPVNGARMVARAWRDPGYRHRLLADGNAAAAELGFGSGAEGYLLKAVENTPAVHNMIVCTLCSCYPTALLGPSPSWYKSFAYRSRAVREPRAVLAEFGLELPDTTEVRVWDANSETRYLVLPLPAEGTEHMGENDLASLVTRNGLIGTAVR
jgi:nitrile hydratase subunit alpha